MPTTETIAAVPDAAVRRRWLVSRIVFAIGVTFLVILSAGIVLTAYVNVNLAGVAHALIPIGEEPPFWTYPLLAYLLYFVLPTILFLPLLLPEALTWRNPRRIVVFRRFKTKERNRALRRIATRQLARFGHVFTLADQQIHRSWFVRVPALFGQLSFLHFRPRTVTSDRRLRALTGILGQRARLNLNWLVSARKIFPIRSSDDYWQACVGRLLDQADLIVMEVSDFSTALSWELHECQRRGLLDRTFLLAERDHAGPVRADLGALWSGSGSPGLDRALFLYRGAELDDPAGFQQRVADVSRARTVSPPTQSAFRMLVSGFVTLTISVALALFGIAVCGPYLWPYQTAQYSPFKSQILTAYFVTGDPAILSGIVATDREWTLDGLRRELAGPSRGHYAANALRDLGDERDIPLLVRYLGRQPLPDGSDAGLGWLRWFTPTAISGSVDRESLRRLLQRLGDRALVPLLDALATVPQLPLDGSLYLDYVQGRSAHAPDRLFEPLLTAPSQAGRFTAAFVLGQRRNIRAVPVLLEILRTGAPITGADADLRGLEGLPGLRAEWLDPYILDDDDAAKAAARLAIASPDQSYVTSLVGRVPAGKGKRILTTAAGLVSLGEHPADARAHAALAHANPEWTRSLRTDPDSGVRAAALFAGAERGDVSIVPGALALATVNGTCEGLLGRYACRPYEAEAAGVLDLLRKRLHPPAPIEFKSADLSALPAPVLASVIQLAAGAGDRGSVSRVVQAVRLDQEPYTSALRTVGEEAEPQMLRGIVRATPPGDAGATGAFLSGVADGLTWRDGLDLCAIAAAEHRPDLIAALRAASGRCR